MVVYIKEGLYMKTYTFINIVTGEIYEVQARTYLKAHARAFKYFDSTLEYSDDMKLLYSTNADGRRQIDHEASVYELMRYR